ncbi:MAG TPA: hypothetical protein VH590_09560 [Ktedonobacterales bacterium]|jgi:hypothetical protein
MPGPHDPNHTGNAGVALSDAGEETGNPISSKEGATVKGSRARTRFWLGMAALLLGLATLAIGFIFFSIWPGVLAVEVIGAGLALLAIFTLLLPTTRRAANASPDAAATDAALERPAEPSSDAALASADVAVATLEPPATPVAAPVADSAAASAAPVAEQPEASAAPAAAPESVVPEAAPASQPARPKTGAPPQNGHAAAASTPRTRAKTDADIPVPRPPLTNLPLSYPRPSGGYSIDTEAEDISQLLGDVAEQTVIAVATRGQRGVERRERMASKIDAFSREMAGDPNYAPVVAFLESISALLRAGQPIPASHALVDPFDGLYGYVITLIRRKTGRTHD